MLQLARGGFAQGVATARELQSGEAGVGRVGGRLGFNLVFAGATWGLGEAVSGLRGASSAARLADGASEVRFIGTRGGTLVHASQAEMRASLEGAGFPRTQTSSPGVAYDLPNGVTARAMEPSGGNTWRTSFNNASGTRVTAEGRIPQPPRGSAPGLWSRLLDQMTHVTQRQ